jgi:hypothetical protein
MRRKCTVYTESEWEGIKMDYLDNNLTQKEIQVKYNVSNGICSKHLRHTSNKQKKTEAIPGTKYNKLSIIGEVGRRCYDTGRKRRQVEVLCDCGNVVVRLWGRVRTGITKSCGCLIDFHGEAKKRTGTYGSWTAMKRRCLRPQASDYEDYGGRGITICEGWLDPERGFSNFKEDMGERPQGTTIDRTNNDGNYEPGNCTWATHKEQANNKRPRKINH